MTQSAEDRSDAAVLREVLSTVSGRPALAPVHAAASALLAELDTVDHDPGAVPPGDVPDVDVPGLTRPRIDQPLGDPPVGGVPGDPSSGIIDAELVGDSDIDRSIGGGISAGVSNQESPTGFTEQGVPTWDSMRDRVENRTTTAMGQEELDHSTPAGRTLDDQWNEREAAGRKKLNEIRRAMKND